MARHLSTETRESTLRAKFEKCGSVRKCRLVRDIVTGKSRRYAFVEFEREGEARAAIRELNGSVMDAQEIVVDTENERTLNGWIPRRFGGGFGGKKESGQLRFGGVERPFRRPIPVNSKLIGDGDGGSIKRTRDDGWERRNGTDHYREPRGQSSSNREKRPRR